MIHPTAIAPHLIAIVGGSGSGKSWLGHRLEQYFGTQAARVSLDDFYRDRSHLPEKRRATINFDQPAAIDWAAFQKWIVMARAGRPAIVPHYDFKTHTRARETRSWTPAPLILVEGLWLLWRAAVRRLFDFSIFVDCPADIRLQRREKRDLAERGRTRSSVRRQFRQVVAPMHEIYVAPQIRWADMVLNHPIGEADVYRVAVRLTELLPPAGPWMGASEHSYDANLWRAYSL
jgi:uridine kinase